LIPRKPLNPTDNLVPIYLKDGTKSSVGFSGFRGINDLAIVTKAARMAEGLE